MKKRFILGALIVIVGIGLIFIMSGCDVLFGVSTGSSQPYGVVIDAKTGSGVAGVTITLTPIFEAPSDTTKQEDYEKEKADIEEEQANNPTAFVATSITDGSFDWWSEEKTIPRGTYRLTASHDSYIFVPQTVQLNAVFPDLGEIVGLPYNATTDLYNVSLVLMWNDSFADVDGHLSFPADTYSPTSKPTGANYDPYYSDSDGTLTGFSPNVLSGGDVITTELRQRIYWGNATTAEGDSYGSSTGISYTTTFDFDVDLDGTNDSWRASLDIDDRDGAGPETITIRDIPWGWDNVPLDPNIDDFIGTDHDDFDGSATSNYEWIGQMEYYARAYAYNSEPTAEDIANSFLSEVAEGNSADATLFVFFGDTIIGIYTIPTYTEVKNASILKINTFAVSTDTSVSTDDYVEFIIYPDVRIIDNDDYVANGFRGLAPINSVVSARVPVN
jgi:hypothetical protein